ncbi:MAG: Gfo/Idh/MocA family protein [Planctomycetota bacterium]
MTVKLAVAGLRHGHIFSLTANAAEMDNVDIVACCEEDKATYDSLKSGDKVHLTHDNFDKMMSEVDCDIVAIGDYYQKRGSLLISALEAGKHVIADKPICTTLADLDAAEKEASEKGLVIGAMLDLRDNPNMLTLKKVIDDGLLGEIHQIYYSGQHPLNYGTRDAWYFEPGKHGGTINDIGIHGVDLVKWLTGNKVAEINAARNWNAILPEVPDFKDAAQFMLTLENGCGVLADVSYFAPGSHGYSLPFYWRFTVWGTGGIAEVSYTSKCLDLYKAGASEVESIELVEGYPGAYLDSFIREINGESGNLHLSSEDVLLASRVTLQIQEAADSSKTGIEL